MTRYTPLWLQSGSYAGSVDRRLIGALWPSSASTGLAVAAAGAGMSLNVQPGSVAIPAANGTGSVLCASDALETVTLEPAPPSGTNRIDLIICQARGTDLDGGPNNDFVFTYAKGAEAASPVAPAVPANAAALAQVAVAGGAASIVAANITDRRPGALAIPTGRILPPVGGLLDINLAQGSKAVGTYTGATVNIPAPAVDSRFIGWVAGGHGFGAAASSIQFDIRRADTQASIMLGGLTGTFHANNGQTMAVPAFGIHVPLIPAGQAFGIYPYYIVGGSNNYFNPRVQGALYPV